MSISGTLGAAFAGIGYGISKGFAALKLKFGGGTGGERSTVIYGSDDIANYQYNMIENPGPLADIPDNPAKNFYGGRYNVEVLAEDKIFYRGGQEGKPQWINPTTGELTGTSVVDTVYAIKIPRGTTIYSGPVGSQGGAYCGGYNIPQIFVEIPWKLEGIEVINSFTLK